MHVVFAYQPKGKNLVHKAPTNVEIEKTIFINKTLVT